jgi:hypothetical protein
MRWRGVAAERRVGKRRSSSTRITLESWNVSSSGVTSTGIWLSPVRGRITSRYACGVGRISSNGTCL